MCKSRFDHCTLNGKSTIISQTFHPIKIRPTLHSLAQFIIGINSKWNIQLRLNGYLEAIFSCEKLILTIFLIGFFIYLTFLIVFNLFFILVFQEWDCSHRSKLYFFNNWISLEYIIYLFRTCRTEELYQILAPKNVKYKVRAGGQYRNE